MLFTHMLRSCLSQSLSLKPFPSSTHDPVCQCARLCSSFDINQIVKLNRESKKPAIKRSKTSKAATAVKATINNQQTTSETLLDKTVKLSVTSASPNKSERSHGEPECFTVLLDSPLYQGIDTNTQKHAKFKDIIEQLEIGYLPSVSTIIKKTESKAQREVLRRWQEAKIKELGGQEQFDAYKKGR